MSKKNKILALGLLLALLLSIAIVYFQNANVAVLEPAGQIGEKERNLIYFALALSLVVVIPVFFMLFYFAYKYREDNQKAKYSPDLAGSKLAETIWWLVPTVLIIILGVVTWNSSHDLDPYKKIASDKKPINIQVVSLNWKWLFIYPDQHVASVNYLQFPENTPINFELTSDSVMNSFWIPQLGGQVYCMPGMYSKLHLIADKTGTFKGSSANISGEGFADMNFDAKSSSQEDFNTWIASVKTSPDSLDKDSYKQLAEPSRNNQQKTYAWAQEGLFATIIGKYMVPTNAQGAGFIIPNNHGHMGEE